MDSLITDLEIMFGIASMIDEALASSRDDVLDHRLGKAQTALAVQVCAF
jgi:hypothetical protein